MFWGKIIKRSEEDNIKRVRIIVPLWGVTTEGKKGGFWDASNVLIFKI